MTQRELTSRVSKLIRLRRKELGMSVQKLSDVLKSQGIDIPRSTIANLESGRKTEISVDDVVVFASALKTTPTELLGFDQCSNCAKCPTCNGAPLSGFKCLSCGQEG